MDKPQAQTLGLPRVPRPYFDIHLGSNKCTPTFRVWREGNIRHAVCEVCEEHRYLVGMGIVARDLRSFQLICPLSSKDERREGVA